MADVVTNLNALHKEVFAEGVPDLVPSSTKIQQLVSFDKQKELGLKYVQPVRLAYPSGFTHAKGDGTAGAFALNDAKAGTVSRAEITAAQILLKDQMDYETAAKASSAGSKSFKEGTKFFYEGMQKALRKRIETQLMYGGQALGDVGAYNVGTKTITVLASTFAPGIWSGLEGCEVEVFIAGGASRGTDIIASVDIDAQKLVLTTGIAAIVATDVIYFKGAKGNEMTGIHGILANSASLFGIDASVYSLWKATSHAVGGAMSFAALKKGISKAVAKGLDEDMTLLLNPKAWDDMLTDVASLRKTDRSEIKKLEIGAEQLVFHSQNGKVEVIPSIFVKEGFAYGLVTDYWKRLGAADVTFGTPGFGGEMFRQLDTRAGVEARAYSHQCVFCEAPAKNILYTGIVNT